MPMHDVARAAAAVEEEGGDSTAMAARVRESFELALLEWQEDSYKSIVRAEMHGWHAIEAFYTTQREEREAVDTEEKEKRYLMEEISRGVAVQIVQKCKDMWRAYSAKVGTLVASEYKLRQRLQEEQHEVFRVFAALYSCEADARGMIEAGETKKRPGIEREEVRARREFEQFYLRGVTLRRSVEAAECLSREKVLAAQAETWTTGILDLRYRVWQKDIARRKETQVLKPCAEATSCTGCQAEFTLNPIAAKGPVAAFKFNCRWCGEVFCDDCTKHRAELPLKGHPSEKVRVCDNCYDHHVTAIWRPDAEAPCCEYCETKFNAFTRRHHCRSCGGIFCNECTTNRAPLFDLGYIDPQLICEPCALRRGVGHLSHAMEPVDPVEQTPQEPPHGIPFGFFGRSRSSPAPVHGGPPPPLSSMQGRRRGMTVGAAIPAEQGTPTSAEGTLDETMSFDAEHSPEGDVCGCRAEEIDASSAGASPEAVSTEPTPPPSDGERDSRPRAASTTLDPEEQARVARREALIGEALRMVGTISHGDLTASLEHLRSLTEVLSSVDTTEGNL
eukprot:TRINITY_DN5849_c0_g1_i1.p1 TRINITY_DN5849_c0_g1~~TRINITY_DN5849_c0_g1_i1.p1  ORF type:complete len:560 (+),score=194.72 TRINITY_DN5849_c0_g1_i1:52-1731(+)